jgi:hypothetical protein
VSRHCLAHPGQRAAVSNVFQIVPHPGAHIHRSDGRGSYSQRGQ